MLQAAYRQHQGCFNVPLVASGLFPKEGAIIFELPVATERPAPLGEGSVSNVKMAPSTRPESLPPGKLLVAEFSVPAGVIGEVLSP